MSYLTDEPIDARALVARVMRPFDGAYVLFEGVVRNHHDGRAVESIFYDAYRPMAEKEMDAIVRDIAAQYPDVALAVVHRLGHLVVGDSSIAIVAWGKTEIVDRDSGLHLRSKTGVHSSNGYHSIDTGKLTNAPHYAVEAADAVAAT